MNIFDHPLIVTFLIENNLTKADIFPYVGEVKIYLSDPDNYRLSWNGMLEISVKKNEINPGLYYLEQDFFSNPINIQDVDYSINPIKADVLGRMIQSKKGYFLYGDNGIGKTFMCAAHANRVYEQTKVKSLFVFWPDFIEKTKRFNNNDNKHYINKVKYAKRLIIDDLGQESISQWSRDDILNPIIAFRLEKNLPTIITSNYTPEELKGLYTIKPVESKKAKAIVNKICALSHQLRVDGKDLRSE